ncbi:MAG: alpha/beta hydrolase [bacterium]|nr:alpha/beta hydrolase [bacterium]
MKAYLAIILIIACSVGFSQTPVMKVTQTEMKSVARDSLVICSTTFGRSGKAASTFVCLPMMGHTRDSFFPLKDSLTELSKRTDSVNFSLPTWRIFDMRGHGCSVKRGEATLSWESMTETEFAKYPADIADALKGTSNLILIGASIGANTAALLTEEMPEIQRMILLSPGLNYRGLEPADAIMAFKGKILLVASSSDEYSYKSVREMASLNPDHCTLMIFDGDAHGTDIINDNPAAMQALVDWILKN